MSKLNEMTSLGVEAIVGTMVIIVGITRLVGKESGNPFCVVEAITSAGLVIEFIKNDVTAIPAIGSCVNIVETEYTKSGNNGEKGTQWIFNGKGKKFKVPAIKIVALDEAGPDTKGIIRQTFSIPANNETIGLEIDSMDDKVPSGSVYACRPNSWVDKETGEKKSGLKLMSVDMDNVKWVKPSDFFSLKGKENNAKKKVNLG